MMCDDLKKLLIQSNFFDVSGGCGFDSSLGCESCMASWGIWFRYCPFCGKKLIQQKTRNNSWTWFEDRRLEDRRHR